APRDRRRSPRGGRRVCGSGRLPARWLGASPHGVPAARQRRMAMKSGGRLAILGAWLLVALLPVVLSAQGPASYTAVTDSRLLNPEPHNWLMYRGNYGGWGYSPLGRITPANVKRLAPVWSLSTGVTEGHQSPPIVNDGV